MADRHSAVEAGEGTAKRAFVDAAAAEENHDDDKDDLVELAGVVVDIERRHTGCAFAGQLRWAEVRVGVWR